MKFTTVTAFLVDKKVKWQTVTVVNSVFTVPAGKQFVVVNTALGYTGNPGLQANCKTTVNGVSTTFISNAILEPGTIVSSAGCVTGTGQVNLVINGYFMNR